MSYKYKQGIGAVPLIIILGLIIIAGFVFFNRNAEAPEQATENEEPVNTATTTPSPTSTEPVVNNTEEENQNGTAEVEVIVKYTDEGFTPQKVEIPVGTTVTFVNESKNPMWVATAVHPTHTVYPGSDIKKCGTDEEDKIFDQCGITENGGSYSFTFNEPGEWKYHNHVRAKDTGTIVVK